MQIIAHRGASHDAPENTLAAVAVAWSQEADAVEVDVHLTRDGQLAVIHDPDTRRTGGEDRAVAVSSLLELQKVDVGRWKAPRFAGQRIPALREVLATVGADKRLFVELKSKAGTVEALAQTVAHASFPPAQVVVISFDLETVRVAKQRLPACEVCWIIEADSPEGRAPRSMIVQKAIAAHVDGLDLEATWVDAAWVAAVRGAGLKLYVWTVDDLALARSLCRWKVDGITTNRPGWLRAALG